ncbi:SRPBCC family protein [Segetibacter sp. 3557_3]|uniref:SRPBCC family protein n=1 Tax=Segetibacter sp. 3557_3 TaxID=2547429 RepID=UPI001058A8B6|nr:SRPBCC family protein [Segetibacter sp. 3557_3]TDH27877.1 SRPBCC family protein [Segetibacter sp. 3557_3]
MTENISKETNAAHRSHVNIDSTERIVSSALGGLLLSLGLVRNTKAKVPSIIAGAILIARGLTGHSFLYKAMGKERVPKVAKNINIRTSIVVNKPRAEVYAFWRELENLPLFMSHLKSVDKIDEKYSVWKAKIPGQLITVDWTAEIVKEDPDNFIGWSSIPDSTIDNAGKVAFVDTNNGEGTELDVTITYRPPLGVIGAGVALLLNNVFEKMVQNDIHNFKVFMETGKLVKK